MAIIRLGELNAPSVEKYRDLPIATSAGTDNFRTLHYILRQFESGNFYDAALLVDAMRRDDRIRAVMQTRVNGLLGAPIEYVPADESDRAREIADAAEMSGVCDFTAGGPLADLLDWGLMLGIAVARITWEMRGAYLMPKLQIWHPQFVYWNWGTRSYQLIHEGGVIDLPDTGSNVYSDGEWLVFTPFGYNAGWMKGLVRSLGKLYLGRGWAYRDWFRSSEKHGQPLDLVYVPESAPVDDKSSFFRDVSKRNAETAIRCERNEEGGGGYDVKLLEASAQTWQTFKDLLERLNTDVAVTALGQNLTTEVQGGSFAAAKVSNAVRGDYQKADAQAIEHVLYYQVLHWWERHNFGSTGLCPTVEFDLEPPSDTLANAQALGALAQSLSTFAQAGVPIDVRAILGEYNIPTRADSAAPPAIAPPATEAPTLTATAVDAPATVQVAEPIKTPSDPDPKRYQDRLARNARRTAAQALKPDVEKVMEAVSAAKDFDEMRKLLLKAFDGMDPSKLADVVKKATILAKLAGRHDVVKAL